MKPILAWATLAGLAVATGAAFVLPPLALGAAAVFSLLGLSRGRLAFVAFAAITLTLDAILLAWASPGIGPAWTFGPIALGHEGAIRGLVGGLRLVTIVGINLAVLSRTGLAPLLDGLRLPPRLTAFLAALLISTQDVARDARRLAAVRRRSGPRRTKLATGIVTGTLVLAVHRARIRRDALIIAGITMPSGFVPVIALASVAIAGRLLLIALPNVALTFVVIFAGGLAFGPRVGAIAAVVAMSLSNLLLTGLTPTSFVNVPAMAVVGLVGGALRQVDMSDNTGRVLAGTIGVLATFLFSIVADSTEWMLIPEFRGNVLFLQARLAAGIAFNLLPAAINGFLFATVAGPIQRAFTPSPDQATHPS